MAAESQIAEFVRIVEAGSLSAAARQLRVPRASLSRRLAKLETEYGVQLLHRDTHRQELTEAGSELYRRGRRIAQELEEAKLAVSALDGVPRGHLRVGLPPGAGLDIILARQFLAAHADVTLEFVATPTHDDLVGQHIDVALRVGRIEDERLIGRKVTTFENFAYGSPELVAKHDLSTLAGLAKAPCVLGFNSAGIPLKDWPLWRGGRVPVTGRLWTNSVAGQHQGAREGHGLALLSERMVREDVASGALVRVLANEVGFSTPLTLVWPATEFMPPKVRAFIDLATATIERMMAERDQRVPPNPRSWEDVLVSNVSRSDNRSDR